MTRRGFAATGLAASASAWQDDAYGRLIAANDRNIDAILAGTAQPGRSSTRRTAVMFELLSCAYVTPESRHHRSGVVLEQMRRGIGAVRRAQHGDGTIDSGNLHSPPDTSFVVEEIAAAVTILRRAALAEAADVEAEATRFLENAVRPLATGGIHTPNHRWVLCAALARLNSLLPDPRIAARIDDWLGEGIDIDPDGQYSERSVGVYSRVTDHALIDIARLMKRPELFEPVRRNLELTAYHMHADGELETVASRRQDAGFPGRINAYYLGYRYMAIHDRNPLFAGVARFIEERLLDARLSDDRLPRTIDRVNPLVHFLEEPRLRGPLPDAAPVPSSYAKHFPHSGLARIRRGAISASIFGGSDWPMGVASGLSSTPTFFTLRNGSAILESVRMSANFFSLGAFHPAGLERDGDTWVMRQKHDAPYYQPLPKSARRADGRYAHTPARDERFWSRLDFPNRAQSDMRSLDQKVTIRERNGGFDLDFDIGGESGVPIAIEFSFRPGGNLEGAQEAEKGRYTLKDGHAQYRVGADAIRVGPGTAAHGQFTFGMQPATGVCLYLTALTPFRRTIEIRAAGTA